MRAFGTRAEIRFISVTIVLGVILFSCSGGSGRITSYGILADDLVVSKAKGGPAQDPPVFSPGEKVFIHFTLSHYQLDSMGNMWIQEDLIMKDENDASILTRPNLINDRVPPPEGATSVPVDNVVTLLDTIKPGDYTIDLSVRDEIGGGAVYIEVPVTVKGK